MIDHAARAVTTFAAIALLLVTGVSSRPASAAPTRAESIQKTRTVIDKELQDHGGSWDAWAAKLKPFRADLEHIRDTTKWPWPATKNYQFQGKEMNLLLVDDLGNLPDGGNPLKVILHLDQQLKSRGIDLILMR